ncbi:MAG: DsbA family oxidoreductase [Chloroflexota bacterium]
MGKSRVDRLAKGHNLDIEWKAFEIHPETPAEGAPPQVPSERRKAASDNLQRMAADEGLTMNRPAVRANSHLALIAGAFAQDCGRPEPFHKNMLDAYWQQQRNISLREVVLDVARESGLDAEELARAIDERRYEAELAAVYDECHRYGISGVPTFIIGRHMVVGAQPYEVLEMAYNKAVEDEKGVATPKAS